MTRSLLAIALVASVLAGLPVPIRADAGPPSAGEPLPLRVSRDNGPSRIVDAAGRQVLLRGVNVNQLNDYFQGNRDLRTTIPLTEEDFADIAALGFGGVRLTMNWSSLEPERGEIDERFVERVHEVVGWAKAHGLYVVLDMHQDAWGKGVVTPPDETCLPGFTEAIGWDGAPAWATFTDGMPTCRLQGVRELSSAVAQAFTSFWADRDGIQTHLVEVWGRLAAEFADEPAVAGYDLLNEPHPGWTPGATGPTALGRFYDRAIAAIREAEDAADSGFHHVVFFEPIITPGMSDSALAPHPAFTDDPDIVFAPHNYAESIELLPAGNPSIEDAWAQDAAAAERYGTPLWIGEWGFFNDPEEQRDEIRRFARQEDAHLAGGAWWVWKQACGDPHVVGRPGRTPLGTSNSLVRYDCPSGEALGTPEPFREVLSRSYPRAAPGRLLSLESDPASGAVTLRGEAGAASGEELDVWVPARAGRPLEIDSTGLRAVRAVPVDGGFRVLAEATGGVYELSVG